MKIILLYKLRIRWYISIMYFILFTSLPSISQTHNATNSNSVKSTVLKKPIKITGKVIDEKGIPIIGANVVIKRTTRGTITDVGGNFVLEASPEDVLQVTYLGYLPQELSIGSKTSLVVVMLEDTKKLNEVVVIGYGEVKRKDLTGSVGRVDMNDLQKAPVKSFDDAMAGRIAGVQVNSADGQPGSLPNITIRGGNSVTQDNSPLYVIDGFPIENNNNNAINPNDIESIDILKDASATAIYGSRGANGVIMITTKRGKSGAPVINYNYYFGIENNINKIDVLNPYDFVKLQLEINSDAATQTYLTGPKKTIDDYKNIKGVDWFDKVSQTGEVQNHNISVSGGSATTKYSISGSYLDQTGIFKNTGFRRYQGRATIDQNINTKLKIGLNINYGDTKEYGTIATNNESGNAGANLMNSVWGYRPIVTVGSTIISDLDLENLLVDPDINTSSTTIINPLLQLQNEVNERLNTNLLSNIYADYTILSGLKLRITGGMNKIQSQKNLFNNSKTWSGSSLFPFSLGVNGSETSTDITSLTNENTLTYVRSFQNKHTLTVLGGFTQQVYNTSTFGASSVQISDESLGLSGLDVGTPYSITSSASDWTLRSFLGRINYDYKGKFMLTTSFRADGSSKFAKGHKWGYFPSAALAYKLGSEDFIKKIKIISDAKFRLTYGTTGNNRVSDFAYLGSITTSNSMGYSFGNQVPSRGEATTTLGNSDLTWETTKQYNAGFDFGLWNDRLTLTTDVYYKETYNLLLNAQLPTSSGFASAYKNIGSVSNKGLEFTLSSENFKSKNFRWSSDFNISFNRNKLMGLTDNQDALTTSINAVSGSFYGIPSYIAKIGYPIAQFYGVVYEGVYQYKDFNVLSNGTYSLKDGIASNGGTRSAIRPGDAKYKDLNNDGIININDYTIIGNPNPNFTGGFNNNFTYRGFDLTVFFQFSYGNDILNANRIANENGLYLNSNINQYATLANRWTPENTTSNIPRLNGFGGGFYSSRFIEDGSFLRLKTVSIGYNLPKKLLKSIQIKSLRVYATAQNLYTWTNYSGLDPEVSTRNSALTPGFDYSPYPRSRTMVFGLNVTL